MLKNINLRPGICGNCGAKTEGSNLGTLCGKCSDFHLFSLENVKLVYKLLPKNSPLEEQSIDFTGTQVLVNNSLGTIHTIQGDYSFAAFSWAGYEVLQGLGYYELCRLYDQLSKSEPEPELVGLKKLLRLLGIS